MPFRHKKPSAWWGWTLRWPVPTSAMSMKWSSEAEANILPSWLKLSVLTGQSSLQHQQQKNKRDVSHGGGWPREADLDEAWKWNAYGPGEAANTHQFLHVPQAHQGIGTSCGEVLPRGVELDTDAVGRVSVDGLDGLQLWITANKQTRRNLHPTPASPAALWTTTDPSRSGFTAGAAATRLQTCRCVRTHPEAFKGYSSTDVASAALTNKESLFLHLHETMRWRKHKQIKTK